MDVVTLGESMVLFVPEFSGSLRYSEKFERKLGGAESNVAIALARLGHDVGWVSKLGNDDLGLYIRNIIRGEGVDTSQVIFDDNYPTGVFFKEIVNGRDPNVYYYRNNSAASTLSHADIDNTYFQQAKYLHLTGITVALSASCKHALKQAIKLAKNDNDKYVVFDPNIRLKLLSEKEAKRELTEIAKDCDIVMPGLDEGKILTGENEPEGIARFFLERGSTLVIVKLGADGAYFATAEENGFVPGVPVKNIIDTVGAGDGFAAGVISGLLREWNYFDAVSLGNKIGAYALSVKGDFEGYPYWEEVNPKTNIKKITR
ncbi:sugar kinase [Gracilibacillus thailandensis]|uniref:Sugar kinase n=1 Tax=Gracilibacillus thailandensis TaxID=563735 RepID=A0A6N7QY51_9BACI|nr:sugar kinase [Gracilibacillus thailandensis]MRI66122.1 sugar kinase [Gracilibacillus thailandensis]